MRIIILLILIILSFNEIPFANNIDWYSEYNSSKSIKIGSKKINNDDDFIGIVKIFGWSKNGLFAYIFDPLEMLICEVEPTFYIIDAKNNTTVFEKHLCDFDLSKSDVFIKSEIAIKLNEFYINPIDTMIVKQEDSRVVYKNDKWLLYVGKNSDERLVGEINDSGRGIDSIHKTDGYLESPFNQNLQVYFFAMELANGNVAVLGNTNVKSKFRTNLYKTGVGIVNNDNVSRSFYRSYPMISSKICLIKEPTDKIKNGIAPLNIHQRKLPLGITVTNEKEGALVSIAPGSEICCLSARGITILTKDYGEISVKSGERLIFVDGTIVVEQIDGSFKSVKLKK